MPGPPLKNAYMPNARITTKIGAVGHTPRMVRPAPMNAKLMSSSLRRPMEFSQNIAGIEPIRKNKLTTLSPRIDSWPSPKPNAVMMSGPNV